MRGILYSLVNSINNTIWVIILIRLLQFIIIHIQIYVVSKIFCDVFA